MHANNGSTGVAAVFSNGFGNTLLLRAEIDALPIEEKTGLPYASSVRMNDAQGVEKPVMHVCVLNEHPESVPSLTSRGMRP